MQAERKTDVLRQQLSHKPFDDVSTAHSLTNLKVRARNPSLAPEVYCEEGIKILSEAAFGSLSKSHPLSSLEAAKILANAFLLKDDLQRHFTESSWVASLLDFYTADDADHEFVGGRISFLLTYKSKIDFVSQIESNDLVGRIRGHLRDHARSDFNQVVPMDLMALGETVKLLYNLASKLPAQMHFFSQTSEELFPILGRLNPHDKQHNSLIVHLLNALALVDWPTLFSDLPAETMMNWTQCVVKILDVFTTTGKPAEAESNMVSLMTVTRKLNELPMPEVQQALKLSLLPQDEERDKPLGQSQTLASRLLRLQTSGGMTVLPEAISGLLFELSERDATTFVRNIGYGHAAGYLMTHKIPIPEGLHGTTSSAVQNKGTDVNPITGQRLDAEVPVIMPEMTEEEKEREAERLYVLFERLRATGVMNVENPVRIAQQSGQFEDISEGKPD